MRTGSRVVGAAGETVYYPTFTASAAQEEVVRLAKAGAHAIAREPPLVRRPVHGCMGGRTLAFMCLKVAMLE